MNIDNIAPAALRLPLHDRVLLATSLWESIEDPYLLPAEQSDIEALELATARDAEIETGMVTPMTHAELMQVLRA